MSLLAGVAHAVVVLPRRRLPQPSSPRSALPRRDLLLPGAVAGTVLGATAVITPGRWADPSWLVLATICALPFWRLRRPVTVATATMVLCGLYYPLSLLDGPAVLAYVLALYTVAATGRQPAAVALGLITTAGAWYGESVSTSHPLGDVGVFMLSGWLTAVIALGTLSHGRSAQLAAVRRAASEAARAREAESSRRAGEERLHLA